jgi:predicted ATPase/DNA-binding SARP family transcriptional activator
MATTAPETDPAPLVITLFGPIQVSVDGHSLPRLRSRKSLWLLALLTLRHGRPVEREWLAGTLWPDADQDQAFASLRVVLSELRKALGAQGVRLQSPGRHTVSLDLVGAQADVLAFDAAIADGTPAALARAVALYTGPLLEGCTEEWVPQERGGREEDCLQALGTLGNAALAAGDYGAAVVHYRRAVVLDPWREAVRRGLMEALARGGDTNAALGVYREFTELLRSDPKAVPDQETSALYSRLRAEARQRAVASAPVAEPAPPPAISGYLPHALTGLVGREDERLEVAARLRRSRLVTLTGPGGIGKTRLALEVAAEVAPEFADGVWLVALEALADGDQVAARIAGALGLKEEPGRSPLDCLTERLRRERALLVLDNCEHLLTACAQVARHLLQECAGVRILATSREALGITGETAWAVPALSVPDPAHLPTNRATLVRVLSGYEGVQLFVERAQAVQKTFALTGENALAVAQICARLEGIPLALELAAARVRVMTPGQMAARLDDHLGLLAGGSRTGPSRQRTLRATLDWSHSMLSVPEQLLLGRLSVFVGGWTLEAAEAVCAGEGIAAGQILDLLTGLVDKSLAVFESPKVGGLTDGTGAGRYRLLEMVRQYASERLQEAGASGRLQARHRDYFLALAEEAASHLTGPDLAEWLRRLESEHDNLRAALERSKGGEREGERCLRLATALFHFWYTRGDYSEGQHFLRGALAQAGPQVDSALRAKALSCMGGLALSQYDYAEAAALYQECLDICRTSGDQNKAANVLGNLGSVETARGNYAEAQTFLQESLSILQALDDRAGVATRLGSLGSLARYRNETTSARALYEQSLRLFQELGNKSKIRWVLLCLSNTVLVQGDYLTAHVLATECLALAREAGAMPDIVQALITLGEMALAEGDVASAQSYFEESREVSHVKNYRRHLTYSLVGLGEAACWRNEMTAAASFFEESLKISREIGEKRSEGASLRGLAGIAQQRSDVLSALALHRESLAILRADGDHLGLAEGFSALASTWLHHGEAGKSVRLWGAAEALRENLGTPMPPSDREKYERPRGLALAALGDEAFTASWEQGRALTWEQAVEYALEAGEVGDK